MQAILCFPGCHRRGGAERVLLECANYLAGRQYPVTVVAVDADRDSLAPAVNITQVTQRKTRLGTIRSFSRAAETAISKFSSAPNTVRASVGVVCPRDSVIWVPSVHAEWIRLSRQARSWLGRLKQRINPFHSVVLGMERRYYAGKMYRRLIALTPRIREELAEHYDVDPSTVEVLPNGYSPGEFNPGRRVERDAVRRELGIDSSDRVVIFVANELERKGFVPLVRAVASLKSPQVKLLVVGRASPWSQSRLIDALGIRRQILWPGPTPDVGRYYAAADVFALPTYYEAWGLVIVEALASGLPVLTSRVAGAAVAVREGETGLLLDDPHDDQEIAAKLDRLLRSEPPDPVLTSDSVAAYRWDVVLQTYERILRETC